MEILYVGWDYLFSQCIYVTLVKPFYLVYLHYEERGKGKQPKV